MRYCKIIVDTTICSKKFIAERQILLLKLFCSATIKHLITVFVPQTGPRQTNLSVHPQGSTHQMMTSSNGNISALLDLYERNPPVDSPHKGQWHGALTVFYLRLNKRLGKLSRRQWFETQSRSLICHYNEEWSVIRKIFRVKLCDHWSQLQLKYGCNSIEIEYKTMQCSFYLPNGISDGIIIL